MLKNVNRGKILTIPTYFDGFSCNVGKRILGGVHK